MPNTMKKKAIPELATEAAEQAFWSDHDSADYVDWSKAETVTFSALRPSLKTISLRLPAHLLGALRLLANRQDVPYQSLLKVYLAERVRQELAGYSYPVGPLAAGGFEVHEPPPGEPDLPRSERSEKAARRSKKAK